jgi:hypothetical protein
LTIEQEGHLSEQAGRVSEQGGQLSDVPSLTFPGWVPPPVIEAATELNEKLAKEKDPALAQVLLSRLVSHPLMDRVWKQVFKKKRVLHKPTQEYLNPAFTYASRVAAFRQKASDLRGKGGELNEREAESLEVHATLLEAEAKVMEGEFDPLTHPRWTRQDRAAQILLQHAYRTALDDEPVYLSSLVAKTNDLREVIQGLQSGVTVLQSHKLNREAGKQHELVEELKEIADDGDPYFDRQTRGRLTSPRFPHIEDPWVIVRERTDDRMRSFVIILSITTIQLFGNALYRTLANITNVAFARTDVTESRVRELLRIRPEDGAD